MFDGLRRVLGARKETPEEQLARVLAGLKASWSIEDFQSLQMLADGGLASAQYELGRQYERALGIVQNLDDALGWYELAAGQGHALAQARAGLMRLEGPPPSATGVNFEQDLERAAHWNHLAAEGGDAGAQLRWGLQLARGEGVRPDLEAARAWLARSAEKHDIAGMTALGVLLAGGYGGEPDLAGAQVWLSRASEAGHVDALYWLGVINSQAQTSAVPTKESDVGEPDGAAADPGRLLTEAAERGHVLAMYQLGLACWSGRQQEKDLGRAETWLRRAMSRGHVQATRALAQLQLEQPDIDGVEAASLLWQAAELGDQRSAALLAELYLQGRGVPRDAVEAARWLVAAGPLSRPQAMTALAGLHASGPDVQSGHGAALSWLERAAEGGDLAAAFTLGTLHHKGLGTPRDDRRAIEWFQKAADAGSSAAAFYLGMLYADESSVTHDDRQALVHLRVASQRGHAIALCNWASMVHDGLGQAADPDHALRILDSGIARGNLRATALKAQWLIDGYHLPRDAGHACRLLLPALAMGDARAAAMMTKLHLQFGMDADIDRLRELLSPLFKRVTRPASVDTEVMAQAALALAQLHERSGDAPAAFIRELYERAARGGLADGQAWLGLRHLEDPRIDVDPEVRAQARRWLTAAARQGQLEALQAVEQWSSRQVTANIRDTQWLTPAEHFQAWFVASLSGHAVALRELGRAYLEGVGCAADPVLAERWLLRAANQGDLVAIELMARTSASATQSAAGGMDATAEVAGAATATARLWHGTTRYETPDYAPSLELIGPTRIDLPAPKGQQWFDAWCEPRFSRPFAARRVAFPAVRAWRIVGATVSAEFVVHRDRTIYIDSSIHMHDERGRNKSFITSKLGALIETCSGEVDRSWSHEQALIVHNEGGDTWGHFLLQNLPRILLFLERFPQGKLALPEAHVNHLASPGPAQLLRMLGVPRDRMLALEKERHYEFGEAILLDFLYDFEQALPYPQALRLIERWLERALLAADAEVPEFSGPRFVARGPEEVGRLITNKEELGPVLQRFGLEPVQLGQWPVLEQIRAWRDGHPKIATLGSDLSNIVFAPRGSSILVLTPDWFGDDFFYGLAHISGVNWFEIRCGRLTQPALVEHRSGFGVDPECLAVGLQTLLVLLCQ